MKSNDGLRRLNPLMYEPIASRMLASILLLLAGISLGAGIADLVDHPYASAAFLDEGWVRSVINEQWWVLGLLALLAYAAREGLPFRYRHARRAFVRRIPIELVAVSILAGITALALSWLSVQFIPCVLESRCGG